MRMLLLPLTALFMLACASIAQSASFPCARARAPDERAICASRALNDQDVRMATMFVLLRGMHAMGAAGTMTDRQREWLTERHLCKADRPCLTRAYARRIGELQADYDRLPRPF